MLNFHEPLLINKYTEIRNLCNDFGIEENFIREQYKDFIINKIKPAFNKSTAVMDRYSLMLDLFGTNVGIYQSLDISKHAFSQAYVKKGGLILLTEMTG